MSEGEYPCCGGKAALETSYHTYFWQSECPHCGAKIWVEFSQDAPVIWTEEAFLEAHDVNEDALTANLKEAAK